MSETQRDRVAALHAQNIPGAEIARRLGMASSTIYLIIAKIHREAEGLTVRAETKACKHCGETFARGYNVGTRDWASRKYCGYRCAGIASRKAIPGDEQPRHCVECRAVLTRRIGERTNNWSRRRFCDQSCSGKHYAALRLQRSREIAEANKQNARPCQQCGELMFRGYKECTRDWLTRRYCSQGCNLASRTVTPDGDRPARVFDPLPGRIFKIYRRLIKERGLNDWAEAAVMCGMRA